MWNSVEIKIITTVITTKTSTAAESGSVSKCLGSRLPFSEPPIKSACRLRVVPGVSGGLGLSQELTLSPPWGACAQTGAESRSPAPGAAPPPYHPQTKKCSLAGAQSVVVKVVTTVFPGVLLISSYFPTSETSDIRVWHLERVEPEQQKYSISCFFVFGRSLLVLDLLQALIQSDSSHGFSSCH